MKNSMLFKLTVIALSFSTGRVAFAQEMVVKNYGSFNDWKVAEVANHGLWKKSACVASTKTDDGKSSLEFYAEKGTASADTDFTEPTIQVVTASGIKGFTSATLTDPDASSGHAAVFNLTLASTQENPPAFGLLSRMSDRKKITQLLMDLNNAEVQIFNAKGKVIKSLEFSLSGATKAIQAAIKNCALSKE